MIRFGDYYTILLTQFQHSIMPEVLQILLVIAFPALAGILLVVFWPLWVNYVRAKHFLLDIKYAVFEIKLPREMSKSPKAMELFLHALHNTSDGSKLKQFWNGETRPWYSLELCSVGGKLSFYIWGEEGRKIGLMSALYAQFPGIEVHEVEDYTKKTFFDPKTMKIWAAEFKFNKSDAYPIKTYIDYGLDKDPKEEFKVDPLVPGLEFLASVGAESQVWIQFVIRAHKDDQKNKKGWFWQQTDTWKDAAKKEMDKIMLRDPKTKVSGAVDADGKPNENEDGKFRLPPTLNDLEKMQVEAISRQVTKLPFDVCCRSLYIAPKKKFDNIFGVGGLISFFKAFNTEHLNGFKPNGDKWMPWLDAPWKDYNDIRRNRFSNEALQLYKMRAAFYTPGDDSTVLVLNSEELATVYHFPGSVAATPGLTRVGSKKSEAPPNLPI